MVTSCIWSNVAYQSIGNRLSKTHHDVQGAGSLEEAWGCVVRSFLRLSPRFLASDRDPPETPGLLKSELEAVLTLLVCAFAAYVTADRAIGAPPPALSPHLYASITFPFSFYLLS